MSDFPIVIAAAASPEVPMNENLNAIAWAGVYARDPRTSSALTWAYFGSASPSGTVLWGGVTVTAGTFTLTDNSANYIVVNRSTGATTCGTATTNWTDTANYARVYKVTTVSGAVTAIEDHRAGPYGVYGQSSSTGGTFTGGTLTTALNEAPAVTIASSTTPAIFAAAGNTINMTGTTTVTGFDTIAAGAVRRVIFGGILQLTYNATSMQNLTSADITTAAGDVAEFESLGSGNTKMLAYTRADGTSLAGGAPSTTSPAFSATPTLSTALSDVIYFGALTANVTAFNLSGTRPKVIVCFVQDGTGGRTVTAGTSIDFGTDIADLSGISATLSTYTYVGFVYNPTTTKFRVVAISK